MKKKFLTTVLILAAAMPLAAAINPPSGVTAVYDGNAIELSWKSVSQTSSAQITGYTVYRATHPDLSENNWNALYEGSRTDTPANDADKYFSYADSLINTEAVKTAGMKYYYRLQSVDINGATSAVSALVNCYPYGPESVTATAFNTAVLLRWSGGNYDNQATAYNIYRSTTGYDYTLLDATQGDREYLDDQVLNGAIYFYSIAPVYGSEGSMSEPVYCTPFAAPFAPTGASALITGSDVKLSWSAGTVKGTYDVTGYNIYRATYSSAQGAFAGYTTATAYTDSVPNTGATYYYRFRTVDVLANESLPAYLTSYVPGPPAVPKNLTATPGTDYVKLTWQSGNTGEQLTYYRVYRNGTQVGTPSITAYTDTLQPAGQTNSYYVEAFNSFGPSYGSQAVTVTVMCEPPSGLTAVKGSTPGTVVLSWQARGSTENVSMYNVYRADYPASFDYDNPSYVTSTTLAAGTITFNIDTGLTAGNYYGFSVAAVTSAASVTVTGKAATPVYVTPLPAPSVPAGLTISAYDTFVSLSWTQNAAGEQVTAYNIYRNGNATPLTRTSASAFTDTGLTNGQYYDYAVSAINYYWESTKTAAAAITPTAAPPLRGVMDLTASGPGDGRVYLSWTAARPEEGVTGYNIFRNAASGVTYTSQLAGVSASASFIDSSGVSGTVYYYAVASYKSITMSALSNEVSAKAYYKPFAPRNIALSRAGYGVAVIWEEPLHSGTNVSVYKYNVYAGPSAVSLTAVSLAQTESYYVDNNVNTSLSRMYYSVRSVDDASEENASPDTLSIDLTNPLSPPVTLVALPKNGEVVLVWKKVTPDSYNIYRSLTPDNFGAPIGTASSNEKEYTDRTVTNNTLYYYCIAAVNSAGEGPKSAIVQARPYLGASFSDGRLNAVIVNKKDVVLSWAAATAGTYTVSGYNVYRSADGGAMYSRIAYVTVTAQPTYTDLTTEWDNKYFYTVKAVDALGNEDALTSIAVIDLPMPKNKVRVFANLTDLTKGERLRLRFQSVEGGKIKLKVMTLSGAFVRTLIEQEMQPGTSPSNPYESQDIYWDARNEGGAVVAAGVYIIILETPSGHVTAKAAVVK